MNLDNYNPIKTGNYGPGGTAQVGYKQVTISSTAKTLEQLMDTDKIPHGSNICFIQVAKGTLTEKEAQINYTFDTSNPTATLGHSLGELETIELKTKSEIDQFKVIARDEDVKLNISFFSTTGNN